MNSNRINEKKAVTKQCNETKQSINKSTRFEASSKRMNCMFTENYLKRMKKKQKFKVGDLARTADNFFF